MIINIDIETRSNSDLTVEGGYKYSRDVTTEVLCYSYQRFEDDGRTKIDGEPVSWSMRQPHSRDLVDAITDGAKVRGWNFAEFDLPVWNAEEQWNLKFPYIEPVNVEDTMEKSRMMGGPGSLMQAARFFYAGKKDISGHKLMLTLCAPDPTTGEFRDPYAIYEGDPDGAHKGITKMERLMIYCAHDVHVEARIGVQMSYYTIPEKEHRIAVLSHKINETGFRIDRKLAQQAVAYADKELAELSRRIDTLTDGVVTKHTQRQRIFEWLKARDIDLPNLQRQTLEDMINTVHDPIAKEVIDIRLSGAKASTAKFKAALNTVCEDDRVRGTFMYYGAPATGRWSGRGIQPHNLPRLTADDPEQVLKDIRDKKVDSVYKALSTLLRPMIIAPSGMKLVRCDFSAIEGRVVAWLAGDEEALTEYKGDGKMYERAASAIYECSPEQVTKQQRQIGKVSELALGFGGGWKAFDSMAQNYGVKVPVHEAKKIVKKWREARQDVVALWYAAERAMIASYRRGAKGQNSTRYIGANRQVSVEYSSASRNMYIELPSGRDIILPEFRVSSVDGPYGVQDRITYARGSWSPAADKAHLGSKGWTRCDTYGGSIVESLAQGIARDLMAEVMLKLDNAKLDIIMHVHDEIVIECNDAFANGVLERARSEMSKAPDWAKGLPLSAEGEISQRFGK